MSDQNQSVFWKNIKKTIWFASITLKAIGVLVTLFLILLLAFVWIKNSNYLLSPEMIIQAIFYILTFISVFVFFVFYKLWMELPESNYKISSWIEKVKERGAKDIWGTESLSASIEEKIETEGGDNDIAPLMIAILLSVVVSISIAYAFISKTLFLLQTGFWMLSAHPFWYGVWLILMVLFFMAAWITLWTLMGETKWLFENNTTNFVQDLLYYIGWVIVLFAVYYFAIIWWFNFIGHFVDWILGISVPDFDWSNSVINSFNQIRR